MENALEKQIRILLVDDEKIFVTNMATILTGRGFDVSIAFDGFEAVYFVKTEPPFDVVILDVKMPGMSGIAVLRECKRISPDTEIIMLTGHAALDSGIQALREGAFDYLMKPCDIEDLVGKIREAYEVERIRSHPILWPRRFVKEIVRYPFIKLETEDLIEKALDVFQRQTGDMIKEPLYIQDKDGSLQGVITRRDLLDLADKVTSEISDPWTSLIENPYQLPEIVIGKIMHSDQPVSADPEEKLTVAAERMLAHNIRCMPVIMDGRIVGIVRLIDIFKYLE